MAQSWMVLLSVYSTVFLLNHAPNQVWGFLPFIWHRWQIDLDLKVIKGLSHIIAACNQRVSAVFVQHPIRLFSVRRACAAQARLQHTKYQSGNLSVRCHTWVLNGVFDFGNLTWAEQATSAAQAQCALNKRFLNPSHAQKHDYHKSCNSFGLQLSANSPLQGLSISPARPGFQLSAASVVERLLVVAFDISKQTEVHAETMSQHCICVEQRINQWEFDDAGQAKLALNKRSRRWTSARMLSSENSIFEIRGRDGFKMWRKATVVKPCPH